ncbi:MAG: peptide MFS transporter [bacterium]|nr:peptide MFS transporter [bacterium]
MSSYSTEALTNYRHPKALYYLSAGQGVISIGSGFTWSLFVVYLTSELKLDQTYTYNIFAAGTAMLGVVGLLCGYLAQKTGYVKSLFAGMILRIIAFALLSIPTLYTVKWSLAFFAVGQGFSYTAYLLVLGRIYGKNDPRRDSGFTFSTFIMNIGFLVSGVAGFLTLHFSYSLTFLIAGVTLLGGTAIYLFGLKHIIPHSTQTLKPELETSKTIHWIILTVCSIIMLPLVYLSLKNLEVANSLIIWSSILATIFWIYITIKSKSNLRNPLIVLLLLCGVQIIWNGLHYCESSSLIIFIKNNIDKKLFGYLIPASSYSIDINTVYTLILTAFFSFFWLYLAKKKKNPSIPGKFTFGMLAVGIGWGILAIITRNNPNQTSSIWWIILAYFPIIVSGAILYPIGNAMIGKYTPTKWEGPMMATFQLYTMGTGVLLGSKFADLTAFSSKTSLSASNLIFSRGFGWMALLGLVTGIIMLIILRWMKKMIKQT